MANDLEVSLEEALPSEASLRERECRAARELDLCRRLMKVIRRRDEFLQADRDRKREEQRTAAS